MGIKDDDDEKKPAGLTKDEVKDIVRESMSDAVNSVVTARMKRMLEGDDFKNTIGEAVKTAVGEIKPPEKEPSGDDKGKGGDGLSPELAQRLKAAEDRATAAEKLAQEERTKREEKEAGLKRQEERDALKSELAKGNVAPEMIDAAVALLYSEQSRIVRTEDGSIAYKTDDPLKPHTDVAAGVKGWLGSDLGKRFLPARDVGGSGGGRGGRDPGKDGKDGEYSDEDLGDLLGGI